MVTNSKLPDNEVFNNKYRVGKYLGSGSICHTYLCTDIQNSTGNLVLKLVYPHLLANNTFPNAFILLTKSAASIQHPNLEKIHETGLVDEGLYIVLDHIPGITFNSWLRENSVFENRIIQGLPILKKILSTLDTLHNHGQFACMKPDNIILKQGNPVITDFWLPALIAAEEYQSSREAAKYLDYLAPELLQQNWGNLQKASDYYTVGVMIYEILVGRPPGRQFTSLSTSTNDLSAEVTQTIDRALSKDPGDRFASTESFCQAIDKMLENLSGIYGLKNGDANQSSLSTTRTVSQSNHFDEKRDISEKGPEENFEEFWTAPVTQFETRQSKQNPNATEKKAETAHDSSQSEPYENSSDWKDFEDDIQEVEPITTPPQPEKASKPKNPTLQLNPSNREPLSEAITSSDEEVEAEPISLVVKILLISLAIAIIGGAIAAAFYVVQN